MGGRGSSGKRKGGGGGGKQYLSEDKALYTDGENEVLYVERLITNPGTPYLGEDVLSATSDGHGNITLDYASPDSYYQQNSRTSYGLYRLQTGITNTQDIHGSRGHTTAFGENNPLRSKVNPENVSGTRNAPVRSVGIDWNNVNSVSGRTYQVKSLLRDKGFKWDGKSKSWKK